MAESGGTLHPAAEPGVGSSFSALAAAALLVAEVAVVLPAANLAARIYHIGATMFAALRAVLVIRAPFSAVVCAAQLPPVEMESAGTYFVALALATAFSTAA